MYEVTIGIPVYQAADYITATLESALSQTYSNIEILIVDDCGGDSTMEVVEQLQRSHPRGIDIRILRNQSNLGVGKSRNRIIEEAQGEFLYFLDSDDTIEPDTIELLMAAMSQYYAELVYGSYEKVDNVNHSGSVKYFYPSIQMLHPDELASYVFSHYGSFQVSVCNCLYRLDFLRRSKLRFLDAMFWEDMAFTYELVTQVSRAVLLSRITYHYLCRPQSLSNYQDRQQLQLEEILQNVSTVDYLKWRCYKFRDKTYATDMCYDLQSISFYIVVNILKHRQCIVPPISNGVLCQIMRHPLPVDYCLKSRRKRIENLLFWLLSHQFAPFFVFTVKSLNCILELWKRKLIK